MATVDTVKPCQHCGKALENRANSCPRCGQPWQDIGVAGGGPAKLAQPEEPVKITLLGCILQETVTVLILGGLGYLIFGFNGLIGGAMLGLALTAFTYWF